MSDQQTIRLPETVENLVRVLGQNSAIALMQAMPKLRFKVPLKTPQNLIDILGNDKAGAFCAEYAGEHFYCPDAANILRIYRDQTIIASDATVESLAREHGLSYRRIQQIRSTTANNINEQQTDLFA